MRKDEQRIDTANSAQVTYRFTIDFWWGTATSATQIEGAADVEGKGPNIWDYWGMKQERLIVSSIKWDLEDFLGSMTDYEEDIELMKEMGHNSFRFSISWSRFVP